MKKMIAGILIFLISFAATAREGSGFYMSAGGSFPSADDGTTSIDPINIYVRVGYDFNDYVGIGIEGNNSLIDDDVFSSISYGINLYTAYLKGSIPIEERIRLNAIIGRSNVELTETFSFILTGYEEDYDYTRGIGIEYSFGSKNSLTVDYIDYYDKNGVDIRAFNSGETGYC